MKRPLIGCVLLILGYSGALVAQTAPDFIKIYDSYVAAVKSGNYRRASSFLSAATLIAINTPQKEADFMKRSQQLRPMQYRAASLTISNDGRSADLQLGGRCDYQDGKTRPLTASEEERLRKNPPPTQGCYLPLRFVKDASGWKLEGPLEQTGEGRC